MKHHPDCFSTDEDGPPCTCGLDSLHLRIAELEAAGTQTAINLIPQLETNNQELIAHNAKLESLLLTIQRNCALPSPLSAQIYKLIP